MRFDKAGQVHRHCDVRTLTGYYRAVRAIEPLAADLSEGIHASLRRRPGVLRVPIARIRVQDGSQGCHERFAGIWIQIAVDPNHPPQRRRDVESSSVPSTLRLLRRGFKSLFPVGHDLLQLSDTVLGGSLQEDRFMITEDIRVGVMGGGEQSNRVLGQLTRGERISGLRHVPECTRGADLVPRRSSSTPNR
jgi:hypothetical protein